MHIYMIGNFNFTGTFYKIKNEATKLISLKKIKTFLRTSESNKGWRGLKNYNLRQRNFWKLIKGDILTVASCA